MLDHNFLIEIATIFLFASVLGLVLNKFRQPAIIAYILTGVLLGPNMLGWVKNEALIAQLSELGIIALLFTLGLEFSFDKFKQVRKTAFFAGILQVIITILVVTGILKLLNFSTPSSLLIGCIVALSSTVIVLKSLAESAQSDSIHGRIMLGILIIQDLSLIPIMLLLPNLGAESGASLSSLIFPIAKAVIFLILTLVLSLKIAPIVTGFITTSKEMLVTSSITIAIGTAIAANYFGIPLELGAFIAGLALSITAHSKQVIAEVIPFRDVFAMVFFVSIGMLMDIQFFIHHFPLVLSIVAAIFLIKFIICFSLIYFARYSGQTALWIGLALFQIGEFSFVLAKTGASYNIIDHDIYSLTIISALITMLLTPFIVRYIPNLTLALQQLPFWNIHFKGKILVQKQEPILQNHVVICGYGPIGKSLAKILRLQNINFIVIEMNSKTINKLHQEHIQAIYGDATNIEVLRHANVDKAKVFVVTLPDAKSNELAILSARSLNEDIFIVARSRYLSGIDCLYRAGANTVIHEEYQTSIAVIVNTLTRLGFSESQIESVAQLLKDNKYQLLQESYLMQDSVSGRMSILKNTEVDWIKMKEDNLLVSKTIADSRIRTLTGASIISIVKNDNNIPNPSPDTIIEADDILVVLGTSEQLLKLKEIINI